LNRQDGSKLFNKMKDFQFTQIFFNS